MNADKHANGRTKRARRRATSVDRTSAKKASTRRIEDLIAKSKWQLAEAAIRKQLRMSPDSHWLWARLSAVRYEQRDYEEALLAANKALAIVEDCPLALWSKAGALQMLEKPREAASLYLSLAHRGIEELENPDADAKECWEGKDWTGGLVADCMFQVAACLSTLDYRDEAIRMYRIFLSLTDFGMQGIYARDDALRRMKRLMPNKTAKWRSIAEFMKMSLAGEYPERALGVASSRYRVRGPSRS
jgi:tetratricopeptide (TPR) repeat protein